MEDPVDQVEVYQSGTCSVGALNGELTYIRYMSRSIGIKIAYRRMDMALCYWASGNFLLSWDFGFV